MLASLPYTTAMLLTLFRWMFSRSVSFSSSATKPMKELSGVWAAGDEQSHCNKSNFMSRTNKTEVKGAGEEIRAAAHSENTKRKEDCGDAIDLCGETMPLIFTSISWLTFVAYPE